MTTALTVFTTQLGYLLASVDTNKLSSAAQQALVKAAVEQYSRDRPDSETDDVTGDAGRYYAVATALTAWIEGFSHITAIEYPAATIASDEAPTYLEPEDWREDYWASDVRYLYLPRHAPAATETMRITYTVPYGWSGTPEVTTTPTGDFYAICHLAAALCCEALSAAYSPSSEASTLNADAVNHRSKAQEYAYRAKEFRALYEVHMNQDGKANGPAGVFVDWDTAPTWKSGRYLYHRGG